MRERERERGERERGIERKQEIETGRHKQTKNTI